jgi:hypothetical protein
MLSPIKKSNVKKITYFLIKNIIYIIFLVKSK